ncbi:helix-turn-helix transcriptional regulator [Paenibacillus sp. P22]|uniref:helix-turn-helix transcriptional regulator n=1 Tax=Paenibacillus sp. P22 TaxID=483908 RepID=UPI00038FA639|nr:AraC family transcriptional regulator [Paenibacillus sp. P22]
MYKSSHPEARQPEDAQAALASEGDQQACAEETVRKPCAASRLVKEVIRFAAENGDKPIGLAEAADHAGVTAAHLSKVFKEETGTTFIKWLTRHRMEEAQRMLRDSRLRTADIACKVGYQDYKYFSLMFKKHAGMSPRDYRSR